MAREQEDKIKVIETEELRIGDNSFSYKKSFVQLSNVSQVMISPVPKLIYPFRYIAILIVSILIFLSKFSSCIGSRYTSTSEKLIVIVSFVAMIVCGIILYRIYNYNKRCGEYLVLNLNSGKNLYFEGNNPRFLLEIMTVIQNCIDDRTLHYVVNMNECEIEMIHQEGDHNTVNR